LRGAQRHGNPGNARLINALDCRASLAMTVISNKSVFPQWPSSLRGAQRRGNPENARLINTLDCRASLAMTVISNKSAFPQGLQMDTVLVIPAQSAELRILTHTQPLARE
jgi:hypothetical protein